jgi:hypothetical protein
MRRAKRITGFAHCGPDLQLADRVELHVPLTELGAKTSQ